MNVNELPDDFEVMMATTTYTPNLSQSLTAANLKETLMAYIAEAPDDVPEGGDQLFHDVIDKLEALQKSIIALNTSFHESADGIIILTDPEFRVMTVQVSVEEVPLDEYKSSDVSS